MSTPIPVIPAPLAVTVAVRGSEHRFPARRVYCVGRNYADHVKEMGGVVSKGRPVFFCKPTDALVVDGAPVPYPPGTALLHHEVELVVAIGARGRPADAASAMALIYGYAVGNDLTRRDLQHECKAAALPWEIAKAFDHSAPISAIRSVAEGGHAQRGRIALSVNGQLRQESDLDQMLWSVPEILIELGKLFELVPGDLIYTGTPAGVGALVAGDQVEASIEGVGELRHAVIAG